MIVIVTNHRMLKVNKNAIKDTLKAFDNFKNKQQKCMK